MRTQPIRAALIVAVVFTAAGCGQDLTVQVTTPGPEGAPQPQANLPLEFLPFDRDSVFDVLDQQAETPRPEMGADLQAASERVSSLQSEWREAESEWSEARDELRNIRGRLDQIDARDPDYRRLYEQFNQLERQERQLDQRRKAAFDSFTTVQAQVATRLDSFRVVRETWADDAYAGYYDIETQLLDGAEIVTDTTNEQGYATVDLPSGSWWVTTRAPVSDGEMYWNVPIPETDTLRLDSENGTLRPRL